jgi:hypothetical protein
MEEFDNWKNGMMEEWNDVLCALRHAQSALQNLKTIKNVRQRQMAGDFSDPAKK